MEKSKPHYDLTAIKAAFADPDTLNRTYRSRRGADELSIDDAALVDIVQTLSLSDFDKSMTSPRITASGKTCTSRKLATRPYM